MKRVKKFNGMIFEPNALFVKEEMEPDTFILETKISAATTEITYVAEKKNPYVTLQSLQYSYITDDQRSQIIAMYEALDTLYLIEYLDATTDTVRFRMDNPPTLSETFEGSCTFTTEINLMKDI